MFEKINYIRKYNADWLYRVLYSIKSTGPCVTYISDDIWHVSVLCIQCHVHRNLFKNLTYLIFI